MRTLAAAGALLCLHATPAAAATVRGNAESGVVVVRDEGGERDRLEVLIGNAVVIRDRRPLTAAGTCRRVRPRAVRCGGAVLAVRVHAGYGDGCGRSRTRPAGAAPTDCSATPGATAWWGARAATCWPAGRATTDWMSPGEG